MFSKLSPDTVYTVSEIQDAKELHMFVYGIIALLVVAVAVMGVQYLGYKNTLHE